MSTLRIGSLFSGFGGLDLAVADVLDAETAWVCDNDHGAAAILAHRFPAAPNLGDITVVDWGAVEPVDIITGGSPCFPAGTLIDTEDGYRPIETIRVGDRVRTHRRRYRPVVQLMRRRAEDTITVKAMGAPAFVTTREHPFWIRRKDRIWNNDRRRYDRIWGAPEWVEAGLLDAGCFLGLPLDERDSNVPELGPELAYLIGRWLGDGWIRDSKRTSVIPQGRRGSRLESRWWNVFICCAHDEADDLEQRITAAGYASGRLRQRTVTKFRIGSKSLVKLLTDFGRGAGGKRIPGWVYRLPVEDQRQLWQGWVDSDGSVQADGQVRVTTVSVELAHGMARVARNAYHRAVSVHHSPMPETCVIEGRTVNQRDQYQVCLPTGNREAFVEDGWVWVPVRSITDAPAAEVFNFGVEEDESYTAWGFAVHNCQDVSSAGRRAGMTPGTRSGLWTAMAGAIDRLRPALVVFENVRGLLSAKAHCDLEQCPWCLGGAGDGEPVLRALGRVLGDLADIGFDACWTGLEAAEVGAPHHRYRIFLAAWPAAAEDADLTAGGQRRLAAPGQAEGGRPRADAGRRGGAPAADAGRHTRPQDEPDRAPAAGRGGGAAPSVALGVGSNPEGDGRDQGRTEPARQLRGPDAALGGGPAGIDWGPYNAAVARWERVSGRPAPAPVDGRGRLDPRFAEWMMGAPDGWICDVPELSRNAQLKAIGNGVVRQQGAEGLRRLLEMRRRLLAAP